MEPTELWFLTRWLSWCLVYIEVLSVHLTYFANVLCVFPEHPELEDDCLHEQLSQLHNIVYCLVYEKQARGRSQNRRSEKLVVTGSQLPTVQLDNCCQQHNIKCLSLSQTTDGTVGKGSRHRLGWYNESWSRHESPHLPPSSVSWSIYEAFGGLHDFPNFDREIPCKAKSTVWKRKGVTDHLSNINDQS